MALLNMFEMMNYAINSKTKFLTMPTSEDIATRLAEIDNMADEIKYTLANSTDKIKTYPAVRLLEVLSGKLHFLCDHHMYIEGIDTINWIETNLANHIFSDIRVAVYYYRAKYTCYDGAGMLDISMLDDINKVMPYCMMIGGCQLVILKAHILATVDKKQAADYIGSLIVSNTLPIHSDKDQMNIYRELIFNYSALGDYENRDKYVVLAEEFGG